MKPTEPDSCLTSAKTRSALRIAGALVALIFATNTWAFPNPNADQLTGRTNRDAGTGCVGCHGSANSYIQVTLSGPTQLGHGQTGTYTITLDATNYVDALNNPVIVDGVSRMGFLVAATKTPATTNPLSPAPAPDGSPVIASATKSELNHKDPAWSASPGSSSLHTILSQVASYKFLYTMPESPAVGSTQTLYGVGRAGKQKQQTDSTWNHAGNLSVTVLPSAIAYAFGGGTVSPDTRQPLTPGSTTTFTLSPNAGFTTDYLSECGGTLAGNVFTTGMVTDDCNVFFEFIPPSGSPGYVITPTQSGSNGTYWPTAAETIATGTTATYALFPSFGYAPLASGCNGGMISYSDAIGYLYESYALAANCTVTFSFIGTPSAPTIGTATAGGGLAAIAFTPSGSTGGSPITGYVATCQPGNISASGPASPIIVTGLTNATAYTCSVAGQNAVGTGTSSGTVSVTPSTSAALSLIAVASRKTHGSAGTFDIAIDTTQTISGSVTVEPRMAEGSTHRVVFKFNQPISSIGTASAVGVNGQPIGSASATSSANEITVSLSSPLDTKRVQVSLTGVNGTGSASASLGFLLGDLNGSRTVTGTDILLAKGYQGTIPDYGTFKYDVTLTGTINVSDVMVVKSRSITLLE